MKFNWEWSEGPVGVAQEHFELSYGNPSRPDTGAWVPVARVGCPKGDTFPVEWLVDPAIPGNEVMVRAGANQLNFFLIEKQESDPWGYAKYHCRTGANMYSKIYWAYFSEGRE